MEDLGTTLGQLNRSPTDVAEHTIMKQTTVRSIGGESYNQRGQVTAAFGGDAR